jgi:hypothetical protein
MGAVHQLTKKKAIRIHVWAILQSVNCFMGEVGRKGIPCPNRKALGYMISLDVLVGYEVRRCVESEPRINKFGFSEKQCSLGNSTNDILKHARLNRWIVTCQGRTW